LNEAREQQAIQKQKQLEEQARKELHDFQRICSVQKKQMVIFVIKAR